MAGIQRQKNSFVIDKKMIPADSNLSVTTIGNILFYLVNKFGK